MQINAERFLKIPVRQFAVDNDFFVLIGLLIGAVTPDFDWWLKTGSGEFPGH